MTLITILLSLVLERTFGQLQQLRKLDWFTAYRAWLFTWVPDTMQQGLLGVATVLLPPVLITLLFQWLMGGWLFGLIYILFGLLVLSYCLGPEIFDRLIEDYINAHQEGERARATELAARIVGGDVPSDIHEQTRVVMKAIIYEGNMRIFGVIFWFILLGPAGALLYRMSTYFNEETRKSELQGLADAEDLVNGLLNWIPARLVALTYSLMGSFDDAMKGWTKSHSLGTDFSRINREILITTGCGAINHEIDELGEPVGQKRRSGDDDLHWVRTARTLVLRALVVWLALIAVMTLAGWFI